METLNVLRFIDFGAGIISFIITVSVLIHSIIFKKKEYRNKFIEYLKANQPMKWYKDFISSSLDGAEELFGKPWSFTAFFMILYLAFFYPYILFVVGYIISGYPQIGGLELFYTYESRFVRFGAVSLLLFFGFGIYWIFYHSPKIFQFVLKAFKTNEDSGKGFITFLIFLVIGTVLTFFVLIQISFILGPISIYIGILIASFSLVLVDINHPEHYFDGTKIVFFLWGYFILAAVSGLFEDGFTKMHLVILFFIFLFPLANSIFDYLSFEMSRFFFRKTCEAETKFEISKWLFYDALIAIILLIGTAACLIGFVEMYNLIGLNFVADYTNINWKETALIVINSPLTNGLGVTLILFSTLIWTFIHATGALIFIFWFLLPFGKDNIIAILEDEEKSHIGNWIAAIWLTLNICIFLFPLVFGIIKLFNFLVLIFVLN